jgi:hypothetical protein
MSFSEISSKTTLLSMSLLGSESSNTSFTERYREKYKDRTHIYEDWLKTARSSVEYISKEIDAKLLEIQKQQKISVELYEEITESHRIFQESMISIKQPKKRKYSEVEKI